MSMAFFNLETVTVVESCTVNFKTADDLVMQGTRVLADMVLADMA